MAQHARASQSVEQLSMLEQERGIARMTDGLLIDQEGIEQQHAAGPEPAKDFRKQPSVEKVDAHHVVDGSRSEARAVEIGLRDLDRRRSPPRDLQRFARDVDGEHAMAAASEELSIAS